MPHRPKELTPTVARRSVNSEAALEQAKHLREPSAIDPGSKGDPSLATGQSREEVQGEVRPSPAVLLYRNSHRRRKAAIGHNENSLLTPFANLETAARKLLELATPSRPHKTAGSTSRRSTGRFCSTSRARPRSTRPNLIAPSPRAGCCTRAARMSASPRRAPPGPPDKKTAAVVGSRPACQPHYWVPWAPADFSFC